jgi:Fe-S cluster assembly ATP-binding protein
VVVLLGTSKGWLSSSFHSTRKLGLRQMLEIRNLHVKIADEDKKILNGLNLTVHSGEVAAIMGPNGSGKSTLSYVIAGKEDYEVLDGEILLNGANILEMEADARAAAGLFLAFQYPLEIPGVATMSCSLPPSSRQ